MPRPHRAETTTSVVAGASVLLALLTGCGPATSPVTNQGATQVCPGEFRLYVQKTAELENQTGTVEEVGKDSLTTTLDGIDPLCVTARAGTRKLPSGTPEPVEYTALINAETQPFDQLIAAAEEQGYTSDAPTEGRTLTRLNKDATFLTIEQFPGASLGLPDQDTPYLILTSITSEEIARLRNG